MLSNTLFQKVIVPSGSRSTSGNLEGLLDGVRTIKLVIFELDVTAATGTLDVFLQQRIGSRWVDLARFPQVSSALTNPHRLIVSGVGTLMSNNAFVNGVGDETISTAGTLSGLPLVTRQVRIKWNIGGTTPSFTFSVIAYLVS